MSPRGQDLGTAGATARTPRDGSPASSRCARRRRNRQRVQGRCAVQPGALAGLALTALLALTGATTLPAQEQPTPPPPDRSAPPQPGPPPRLRLPQVQRFELGNGLLVVLMEKRGVPLVQANLVLRAGSVDDPAGRGGLATMTAEMLDEGAGGLSALALAEAIETLGARLEIDGGLHTTEIALHVPAARLGPALDLMAKVALNPDFPTEELERQRTSRLTDLLQRHDEPRAIAATLLDRVLYGADHPYGRPPIGDEASIRALTVEDLRGFHAKRYIPRDAFLIVVGDVQVAAIKPLLDASFGEWTGGDPRRVYEPDATQVSGRAIHLVDKPGAAQSELRIGRIGAARSSEDYYALQVLNTVLGGSFTSRLNQNLRERNQFSYGAGSAFQFRLWPGPFLAASAVETGVTDRAVAEMLKEIRGMLEPVPADELERAKSYLALRYPSAFQSVAGIARQLEDVVLYNLPGDYFNRYVDRVLAVTAEDVQRVAREYLDAGNLAIVVVGDRATVEAGLRAADIGPLEVLSVEDVLGPKPQS